MNKKHSVIAKTAGVGMLGLSLALCGLSAPLAPQAQSATTSHGTTTAYADTLNFASLADGEYTVAITALYAPNGNQPSMMDQGLVHTAPLSVKSGVYTLQCTINEISTLGQTGGVQKVAQAGTVAIGDYPSAPFTPLWSTDNPNGAAATFNLTVNDAAKQNGLLGIQIFVPAMENLSQGSGTQTAFIKIDTSSVKLVKAADNQTTNPDNQGGNPENPQGEKPEGGTPEESPVPSFDQATKRIAGATAEDTMQAIVQTAFPDPVKEVVLATSESYWDALSANSLAGSLNAPVLLTHHNQLPAQTIAELKRLKTSKVVVCGGENAISNDVVSQLKDLNIEVERIAGTWASDTANDIAKKLDKSDTAIVATSWGYEDALSAASYAYANKAPIFLANYNSATLDASSIQTMKDKGVKKVYIVGGTSVVSPEVEAQLSAAGITVERIAGETAYDTSAKLATRLISLGMHANNMAIATGWGYTDALAGAALCGKQKSVMVLADNTNQTAINDVVAANKHAIKNYYIFGGTSVVGDIATDALKGVFTGKDAS
ncbi:cell wall-binding repeat-containing protein [Eggerthellaceae bacterium DNF00809]